MRYMVVCIVLSLWLGCKDGHESKVRIAAASNLQFVVQDLVRAFEKESGISCDIIMGSSGKLTAQIVEGAPYDLFLSADMKYPLLLYQRGLTIDSPYVYALGQLVLWSVQQRDLSLSILIDPDIQYIALPNPKIAPYGMAAFEVLKGSNLLEEVEHKLVYGESISQTNQFILSKSADLGFTALSVVKAKRMLGLGDWVEIDRELYSLIQQGVVVLGRDRNAIKAKRFRDFLFMPQAQSILKSYGYLAE